MIKLIVAGRIGQDAEIKSVGDTTVCSFSVAHTEKTFGNNPTEKTVWVTCSMWGERGSKLAPHLVKGTYVVVEGTGGVNAYMKNGEAAAVIRCMVNSIEFGGKPSDENPKVSDENPKVSDENPKVSDENPKVSAENPKVSESTTFKPESDFPF